MEEDQTTVAKAAKDNKLVASIEIKGQDYIAAGAKATFKAVVTPSKAKNKKVTWDFDKEYQGVSIGKSSGKVKVAKDVKPGTKITIIAKALDQSGVSATKTFTIKEKAKSITLETPETTTIATKKIGDLKTEVTLKASIDNGEEVAWKVSDPQKVSITSKDNKATVTAIAPGKVTVTAYANDGSGVKAKVKLNVIIPASSFELRAPKKRSDSWLALGCSLKLTPEFCLENGKKPTNSKVEWDYGFVGFDEKYEKRIEISDAVQEEMKKNKYCYTFSKGKVTALSQKKYDKHATVLQKKTGAYHYAIVVTAKTTDGSNIVVKKLIKHIEKNEIIKINISKVDISVGGSNKDTIVLDAVHDFKEIYFENSNPEVAYVRVDAAKCVWIKGLSKGTSKVNFMTMDGSGLSTTLTIIVH